MKRTSQAGPSTIIKDILLGQLAGMLTSTLLLLFASVLIHNGTIAEYRINLIISSIQFVSVLISCLLAGKKAGQKYAIICGATALIHCVLLLCVTIMFFDSSFQGVGTGVGMCAAGCVAACTICMTGRGKKRKR